MRSFIGKSSGWQCNTDGGYPDWWMVNFAGTQVIDTVVVYTWPQHNAGRNRFGLRDYDLEVMYEGGWETIERVRGNVDGVVVHRFSPRPVKLLRLWILRNNSSLIDDHFDTVCFSANDHSRILQIEAYNLGADQVSRFDSVQAEHELGPRGAVAIFVDGDIPASPGHADPDQLASFFRGRGYGVSFLSAKALCCPEIFNRRNFDVLVHPYGPYFPMGSYLYQFLESGGHLISFDGKAFSNALEYDGERWRPTGWDMGLCMTELLSGDYYHTFDEQVGLFAGVHHELKDAAHLEPAKNFLFPEDAVMHLVGPFQGTSVVASVGRRIEEDEERELQADGRWPDYWCGIRQQLRRNGFRWGEYQNYSVVFNKASAVWIPLLVARDGLGQLRGTAAALIHYYEGPYRGSICAASGVTNSDLSKDVRWLSHVLDYIEQNTCVHDLAPEYDAFHPGEVVRLSVWVDHFGHESLDGELVWEIPGIWEKRERVSLQANHGCKFTAELSEELADGLYRISVRLRSGNHVVGEAESGFVFYDPRGQQTGPRLEFYDNFLRLDERATFLVGCRDDGLHQHGQVRENALEWDRTFNQFAELGFRVISPVFFSGYLGQLVTDGAEGSTIPEIILRQYEAQAFLANRRGVVYAPCIFFEARLEAQNKPEVSSRICQTVGERLRPFPAVYVYLYDDGHVVDPSFFNRWTATCREGFEATGRRFLLTGEFGTRLGWPHTVRECAKNFDFNATSNFEDTQADPTALRNVDMRIAGKSQTIAEFGRQGSEGIFRDRQVYCVESFLQFVAGHSLILNWKWKDNDHCVFPWGIIHPGDWVPKDVAYTYRNAAIFYGQFEPVYEHAAVTFVWPTTGRTEPPEGLLSDCKAIIRGLMEAHVEFNVIDEDDLRDLPDETKFLIVPSKWVPMHKGLRATVIQLDGPDALKQYITELPRHDLLPDDPGVLAFRNHSRQGTIYGLCISPNDGKSRRITWEEARVEMSLQGFGVALAAINREGEVFAWQGQGALKSAVKALVESDMHVMVYALDGKSLSSSRELLLLADQPGEVKIANEAGLKYLEVGYIRDKQWICGKRTPIRVAKNHVSVRLDLEQVHSICKLVSGEIRHDERRTTLC